MLSNNNITRKEDVNDIIKAHGGAYILYRNVGGIGDAVMIAPAIKALRDVVGKKSLIIMATIPYCAPVFYNHPDLDFIIDSGQWYNGEQFERHFNELGCYVFRLSDPCPAAVYESTYCPNIARSRQDLFCEACGVKFNINNYRIRLTEDELGYAKELVPYDRYIVVQGHSNDKRRDYPHWRYRALVSDLIKHGTKNDYGVVVIDPDRRWLVKGMKQFGSINLRYLMSIVKGSDLMVAPDSMGVHVAGALEVPTYGIFGTTSPYVRLKYKRAYWNDKGRCTRQYCWYLPCKFRFCFNTLTPSRLFKDICHVMEEEWA